jgi:uncharacterized SAM-binding protein YcdF (DUF218 family)
VIKFIYSWVLPPGVIILSLFFLSLWLYRKNYKTARVLLVTVLVFYFLSTGYISSMLMRSLECRYEPPAKVVGDAIIILGGGATFDTPNIGGMGHLSGSAANRVLTGFVLQRQLGVPIIVAGGQVYGDSGNEAQITGRILKDMGVSADKILLEDQSLNTRENVENVKKILDAHGFKNPVLVTSAFHMNRAAFYFARRGIEVLPYPADYRVNIVNKMGVHRFEPRSWELDDSCTALKEYLGLAAAAFLSY